jgi:succinyl-CoA synthetase beta subunit
VAQELGGRVVLKSQLHAGGRGKGHFVRADSGVPVTHPANRGPLRGIVVVEDAREAATVAGAMLGQRLITRQTGPQGRVVRHLLVEAVTQVRREIYVALLLDRSREAPVFVVSGEGGTEIEELAAERPSAILKVGVDPGAGYSPWIARRIAAAIGLRAEQFQPLSKVMQAMHTTFMEADASLVEVNPLIEAADGSLVALDAKMSVDDNALFRHPELRELRDLAEEDPLEVEASRHGLNYVKLDGNVGCMVNGAGLAMATMDIIQLHGGRPANFLDVGGGATAEMVTRAFEILLADPNVRAVLINIFGGIMRCDVVAQGVVEAASRTGVSVPVVVRLEGTNVEQGRKILQESGLRFQVAEGMEDAARKAVQAAGGR